MEKKEGAPIRARHFHVVGGGCFGSQYIRWLIRAKKLGMVTFEKIWAIDRNPQCQLKTEEVGTEEVEIVNQDWMEYFSNYLLKNYRKVSAQKDFWVPSPLSPPILFLGFLTGAKTLIPKLDFQLTPFREEVDIPVVIPLKQGPLAVSFAKWKCPVNCIEPNTCPAIHEPRTWEMKRTLDGYFQKQAKVRSAHVLKCRHLVHGVGAIPCSEIFNEFEMLLENLKNDSLKEVTIATVSGCHGLIGSAEIL